MYGAPIASSIIYYLITQGLKRTLEKLDSELPRDSERLVCYIHRYKNLLIHFPPFFNSINNRVSLMKALCIENLVKNNKVILKVWRAECVHQ